MLAIISVVYKVRGYFYHIIKSLVNTQYTLLFGSSRMWLNSCYQKVAKRKGLRLNDKVKSPENIVQVMKNEYSEQTKKVGSWRRIALFLSIK
ncbi:hypothetical protein L0B53_13700 [Vibrio sp. SS-MA-C1-2]|uniref:hypothetical protein n=1 Tax=Vibrio sp. SS-MA-C1-2 TaxID=2908646 RepID=UPI001F297E2F|nr:hypothetical protein [Vibrio sp. SS-MA-C1-2]UJF18070.1 hypothetical protein L0B53_13700 [Vibrio sp. SS-MA-C1-2]